MALKKKTVNKEEAMTVEEKEAIVEDEKKRIEASANMERLQLATRVVSERFNLDDEYCVTKFNDKGKVVDITLENGDFIISCTIKNSEAHGMYVQK